MVRSPAPPEDPVAYASHLLELLWPSRVAHSLALYAVQRRLHGLGIESFVVEREIFDTEKTAPALSCAYGLRINGQVLGGDGRVGWEDICKKEAIRHGIEPFFVSGIVRVVQWPGAPLDWKSDEIDEIEQILASAMEKLVILEAAHGPSGHAPLASRARF